jgi:hypothetical protein
LLLEAVPNATCQTGVHDRVRFTGLRVKTFGGIPSNVIPGLGPATKYGVTVHNIAPLVPVAVVVHISSIFPKIELRVLGVEIAKVSPEPKILMPMLTGVLVELTLKLKKPVIRTVLPKLLRTLAAKHGAELHALPIVWTLVVLALTVVVVVFGLPPVSWTPAVPEQLPHVVAPPDVIRHCPFVPAVISGAVTWPST